LANNNAAKNNAAKNSTAKNGTAKKTHRTGQLIGLGAAAMGVVTASVGVITPPAFADDYPSWNDVQQAKANVAQQQALVDKITGLIQGLQQQVDAANIVAEKAAEQYFQAKDALAAATKKADDLQKQADAADKKAKTSQMRAGLLASHLARSGGQDPTVNLMLKGGDSNAASKLLDQLGTMSKLTEQSQGIYDQAVTDKNEAQALTAQAKVAKTERGKLADAAEAALEKAKAAQAAVQSALATQQQKSTELVAQLASLQSTSTAVAQQYAVGEQKRAAAEAAAAEAQRQRDQAAADAAAASGGNAGSSSGGGDSTTTAPPNGNAVDAAISYARAQLGKPYIFGGEGPYGYDCSGLTMMAYRYAGIYIGSHSVNNQWYTAASRGQIVSYGDRQPGDLIFWGDGPGDFYHIGIYIGGGMMIAAPTEGDVVKIQSVWGSPYWQVARPSA
jgi:cell wall-associated NlpC family hydrolase